MATTQNARSVGVDVCLRRETREQDSHARVTQAGVHAHGTAYAQGDLPVLLRDCSLWLNSMLVH